MKFCVAGLGRCGTALMTYYLLYYRGREDVVKTHKPPNKKFKGKAIFMFGDPRDIVVSAHENMGFENIYKHYQNFAKSDWFNAGHYALKDTLGLERLFNSWYRQQPFDLLTARYETLWDHLDEIKNFWGLPIDKFPKYEKRKTDWTKHPKAEQINSTYGSLAKRIEKADDIKLWKAL